MPMESPLTSPKKTSNPLDPARPLFDHIEEIRTRLLWSLGVVVVMSMIGYQMSSSCFNWLSRFTGPMVFISPTEAFVSKMKLSFLLGLFFSTPVLLFHLWKYVGLALSISERRIVLGVLPFTYLLFSAGAALGWFVVVPAGLRFLVSFGQDFAVPTLSVNSCITFSLWITLGLGLLFQLPVVVAALAKWGLLRAEQLRAYRKQALVVILIIAAMITPGPDVVSQLLLAAPTYLLYEFSIWLASVLAPKVSA